MEMHTNNFAVPGTRTTGSKGATVKVIGPLDIIVIPERNVVRSPAPHASPITRVLVGPTH